MSERVSDEDLNYVMEHLDLGVREYALVDAVVAELMALRKVADAASRYLAAYGEEDDAEMQTILDVMEMALKEAGR